MKTLLFIHIPKTAGCSFRCLLEKVNENIYKNNIFINPELLPTFILYFLLVHPFFNNKFQCIKIINNFYFNKNSVLNISNNNNHTLNFHNPIKFYKTHIKLNNFHSFTIVRHPYTRTLSLFRFTHPDCMINETQFHIFLNNLLNRKLNNNTFFFPQSYYVKNKKGTIIVNTILKLENMNKIKRFFIKNGYTWYLPIINKTKPKKIFELTETMKRKIYLIYKEDFETFNYYP